MKTKLSLARAWCGLAAVALISAACVPIPDSTTPILTPTASVFLPNVEAPGAATSPLQPTTAPTSSAPLSTALVMTPTLSSAPATATRDLTPLPTYTATPTEPATPTLIGPVWQWVSSALKDSPALVPRDPSRYTFQLLGDGNALIQADCNFGTGSYQESGESFAFTAIGTTKMACPPDSLDSAFLAQLRYIASYSFEADELVITLKEDAGTMRLRSAPTEATGGAIATEGASPSALNRAQIPSPAALPTNTPRITPPATPWGNELTLVDVAGNSLMVLVRK